MKKDLLLLSLLYGCSQLPPPPKVLEKEVDMVTIKSALDHAQTSYLKGCVDGHQRLKVRNSFPRCRDLAKAHRQEVEAFMNSEIKDLH